MRKINRECPRVSVFLPVLLLVLYILLHPLTSFATEVPIAGLGADAAWLEEGEKRQEEEDRSAGFDIHIRFDNKFEMLTEKETSTWRSRTEDGSGYIWDDEKVYAYFEGLKEKYDTTPGIVRFVTHDGRKIEFQTETCGWQMNLDMSVMTFEQAVDSGQEEVDPIWNSGCEYSSKNDVGQKYVEVDIGQQKLFLYEYGKLVFESDCVTGTKDYAETDTGVYQVIYKASPSVLKDKDPEGYEYEQPVEYWICYNGSEGIHDATWRSEFGGEYYKVWGSHGCVNLPLEAAKRVYEEVYTYYPVVVYE